MASRFKLKAPTMEAIRAKIAKDFDPAATIISAERVTTGGLAGFFAEHHFEAIVEVPGVVVPVVQAIPAREGIASLLEELVSEGWTPPAGDTFTTSSPEITSLLDGLSNDAAHKPEATN